MVSTVRRYRWFLFIKSQHYNLVSATRRYQRDIFIGKVPDPLVSAGPLIQVNMKEMSLEAYIFIGRCRFCVGGFKLVHPLSASCFSGSVRAIGGSFPSELPLCSGLESQLSDFLIGPASRSPQSKQTASIAKKCP